MSFADLQEYFQKEWSMISGAPVLFATALAILTTGIHWWFRHHYRDTSKRQADSISALESRIRQQGITLSESAAESAKAKSLRDENDRLRSEIIEMNARHAKELKEHHLSMFAEMQAQYSGEQLLEAKVAKGPTVNKSLPILSMGQTDLIDIEPRSRPVTGKYSEVNCRLLAIEVTNDNLEVGTIARNLRCELWYEHSGGSDAFSYSPAVLYVQRRGISGYRLQPKVDLASEEKQKIVLAMNCFVGSEWHSTELPRNCEYIDDGRLLQFGGWLVKGTVRADNCNSVEFAVKLRVSANHELLGIVPC
jgi:hypothetical protein